MKMLLFIGLLLLNATNVDAGIFTKKKSGRTCVVCKQQMAWSDGRVVELKDTLDKYGKHRVTIVKTEDCVKKINDDPDMYLRKKSIWSFKDNKHRVTLKDAFNR